MPRWTRLAVLSAALLAGCGGSYTHATHWMRYGNAVDRYAIRYPQSWHRAASSLTPHLADPHEIFTVSTGPLPAGGRCANLPAAALAAMGPAGALVTIQERAHGTAARRPVEFQLSDGSISEAPSCVRGARFSARVFTFRDRGRNFFALIGLGHRASAHTRALALKILDSFRPAF
jgi:hypothetical protein